MSTVHGQAQEPWPMSPRSCLQPAPGFFLLALVEQIQAPLGHLQLLSLFFFSLVRRASTAVTAAMGTALCDHPSYPPLPTHPGGIKCPYGLFSCSPSATSSTGRAGSRGVQAELPVGMGRIRDLLC